MQNPVRSLFSPQKWKFKNHRIFIYFLIPLIFTLFCFNPVHAFEPNDITGLELWLKADSLSLNNNDPVTSWSDSSTAGNNFSQTNPNDQPSFKASVSSLNSKPAVHFDGAQFIESITNFELNDFALFVVYQDDGTVQENERLLDHDFTNGFYLGRNKKSKNSWGGGVLEPNNPFGVFVKLDNDEPHTLYSEREGSGTTLSDEFWRTKE